MRNFDFDRIGLLGLSISAVLFFGCSTSEDPAPVFENVVSTDRVWYSTVSASRQDVTLAGLDELLDYVQYDVATYLIEYKSTFNGEEIVASGLIGLPIGTTSPVGLTSIQHGTIVAHDEAPSKSIFNYRFFTSLASSGMIVLIPDFLGFGESEQILHPYYVEEASALAVVDMVKAVEELIQDSVLTWNGDLFLTGYSEGGYVTMAAHKYIQEHPEEGLEVTASAPAAGGYDLLHMKDYFFSLDIYFQPFYMAYVVSAYTETFGWTEPMSLYFQEPYASRIPTLFDGSLSGGQINDQLTTQIPQLLNSSMVENFDTSADYAHLRNALMDNDLTGWVPDAPVRLYHGTEDITVPYSNSVQTLEKLLDNGATSVELISLDGANHFTGFLPMVQDVMPWILEFNSGS